MLNRVVPAGTSAALVCVVGSIQIWYVPVRLYDPFGDVPFVAVFLVAVTAGLVLLSAFRPGAALVGLWLVLGVHALTQQPLLAGQVGVAFVAFACSAWGSRTVLWASLLSIPAAALSAVLLTFSLIDQSPWDFWFALRSWGVDEAAMTLRNAGWGWQFVLGLVGLLLLMVPWLAGLAVRLRRASDDSARQQVAAEAERDAAAEVAALREGQAQLARDVHDVVGHSLTVILAQAEAGRYQDDTEALHRTLGTIIDTAQSSLADVRRVLEDTGNHRNGPEEADLLALLAGVRAGGREVLFTDEGQVRPLPPELGSAAHRVLQEMLTNAVRHGRPDAPIHVERHWAGDLRLEVSNALPAGSATPQEAALPDEDLTVPINLVPTNLGPPTPARPTTTRRTGNGIPGMRRRVEAVGGRLDVRLREEQGTFTVTAWIPLPGRLEQP